MKIQIEQYFKDLRVQTEAGTKALHPDKVCL